MPNALRNGGSGCGIEQRLPNVKIRPFLALQTAITIAGKSSRRKTEGGAGKTYLACALGNAACRNGYSVRYYQSSRLLQKLAMSHADGSYPKFLEALAKTQLLILDDWLRNPPSETQTQDLLEIMDDRYKRSSTILSTQIPVSDWPERFAAPTLSDAILDRIVHNAYRLELKGESMRKQKSLTHSGHPDV